MLHHLSVKRLEKITKVSKMTKADHTPLEMGEALRAVARQSIVRIQDLKKRGEYKSTTGD